MNLESELIEYNDEIVPWRLSICKLGNLHTKFLLMRIEILKLIILRFFYSSRSRKKNQNQLLIRLMAIIERPEESKIYMSRRAVMVLDKSISKTARFFSRA